MSLNEATSNFEKFLGGITSGFTGLHFDNDQYSNIFQVQKEAMLGDMLEFRRNSNTHYALYIGQGKVISVDAEDSGAIDCACVQQHTLKELCDDGRARVQNHEHIARSYFSLTARNSQDIIEAAKSFENRMVPYEFDFRNSEYYCTLWRYGKGFSTQVAKLASISQGPKSNWWTVNHTCTDILVKDEYAKYKQLAVCQQNLFEYVEFSRKIEKGLLACVSRQLKRMFNLISKTYSPGNYVHV